MVDKNISSEAKDSENKSDATKLKTRKVPMHNWAIATYIFAILSVVLLIMLFTGNTFGLTGNVISQSDMKKQVDTFVNTKLLPTGGATIDDLTQKSGLYVATVSFDGEQVPLYFTKDGKFISPGSDLLSITSSSSSSNSSTNTEDIPKSSRPTVELFVMSFCPYGVNAEKNILPVIDLLGSVINFKIRYIVTVNGNTISDVSSLHGLNEAKEDARQLIIMKYYPDKFYSYLKEFDNTCYPVASDSAKLDQCWKNTATKLGMDTNKIETAAYSSEGINLLKAEQTNADKYSVSGSPTLIINGVQSTSIYSGTQSTQEAICSAFNQAPSQCSQIINSSSSTTTGSC